jgi:hypothetical protein
MHNSEALAANEKIETALALNPIAPDEYLWRAGGIKFLLHRYDEALTHLLRMVDRSPAARLIAATAAMAGRDDLALRFSRVHLAAHPAFTVEEWARTIPLKKKADVDHYVKAMRLAGFR